MNTEIWVAIITAIAAPLIMLTANKISDHIKEKQGKRISTEQLNESVKELKQSVESVKEDVGGVKEDVDGVNNRLQQHMNEH